jgi:signal transduction histidine kinase
MGRQTMKLRSRLLIISVGALLVPVLVAIAVAAAIVVGTSGRSQEDGFRTVLTRIRGDISATEQRYRAAIAGLALSDTVLNKLYVYSTYWNGISKDTLNGDIAVLRDDLEGHLLKEGIDTIAVYRREGDHYSSVVVVGNSTYVRDSVSVDLPVRLAGQADYEQTSDGMYATFYRPVERAGRSIGCIALQKAFNRSYLEALHLTFGIDIAFYAQGLYRYSSLPGIEDAGVLWTRARSMTASPFPGTYTWQGRPYRYLGSYIELGPTAKGFLFVGGASSITWADWWRTFARFSILPLICVGIATLLFILWGSEVIRAIKTLLAASVSVARGDSRVQLPVHRRDEFGELYRGFTSMAVQLEENRRLLVTSEKMAALGTFSAGVAHEVNNPLGIILNHVQLLRSGRLDPGEREDFLARIETEIKRVNRLLKNFLHHASDDELAFSDCDLASLVAEVAQLFAPKLRVKGVRVEVAPFPPGAIVEGDADAVKQVLFNLLYNAIQAIHHDHGLVRIGARSEAQGFSVEVADNGEGMDAATKASIFQPFVTRKKGYGTGLGLAVSQTIMKQHGGSIRVDGEQDVGTTVTLWFPRKEETC